jgi:hypothetical protein
MQRVNNQENVVTKKKGKEIEVLRRKVVILLIVACFSHPMLL